MIFLLFVFIVLFVAASVVAYQQYQLRLRLSKMHLTENADLANSVTRLGRSFERIRLWMDDMVSQSPVISVEEWPDLAVRAACSLLRAKKGVYVRIHPALSEIEGVSGRGLSYEHLSLLRIHTGEGWFAWVAQAKTVRVIATPAELNPLIPQEQFLEAPSLFIPLQLNGDVHAIIAVWSPEEGQFHPSDLVGASMLAQWGSVILNLFQFRDRYDRLSTSVQQSFRNVLEARDGVTCNHSDRTAYLTRLVAEEANWPKTTIDQAVLGAALHDIGKCGISDAILLKPGPLTPQEYEEMKKHADKGFRIVNAIPGWEAVASVVRYHQEWFNGQGYPEGIAQEEIPMAARLVSIVDAWDAMTSNRPYRQAIGKQAALGELRRQAGTQFDPKLTDLFLKVLDRLEREGLPTTELDRNPKPIVPVIP